MRNKTIEAIAKCFEGVHALASAVSMYSLKILESESDFTIVIHVPDIDSNPALEYSILNLGKETAVIHVDTLARFWDYNGNEHNPVFSSANTLFSGAYDVSLRRYARFCTPIKTTVIQFDNYYHVKGSYRIDHEETANVLKKFPNASSFVQSELDEVLLVLGAKLEPLLDEQSELEEE